MGYITCGTVTLLLIVSNLFIGAFPARMLTVIILYYIFLCSIWLSITVMYILEKELIFTGVLIGGILTVYIFFIILDYSIIISQIIALFIVSIASIIIVIYIFRNAEQEGEKGISPPMPRMSITLYSIMPYFLYGFLYFTLLFTDRIIAWSTNDVFMPYIIWFRGAYELGLDFALLMLVIPMGVSEVVINRFMISIENSQKDYMGNETSSMNRYFTRMYHRLLLPLCLVSFLSSVIIYVAVTTINRIPFTNIEVDLVNNYITHFVFIVALISYAIIAIGLLNSVVLFSLSQPAMAGRVTLISLLANVVSGFLLSRWIDYYYAVFGLLLGAIFFAIMTGIMVTRVLKNLDYYLYASV